MARLSPLMALPLLIASGFVGLALWGMSRPNPDALPSALVGQLAPMPVGATATALADLPTFAMDDLADGKVKIVNFWASWCGPCRAEHPHLVALQQEGIPIYGINYKDAPSDAEGFLASLGNPYDGVLVDADGRMGIDWGIYGVPETFVLDGEGRIVLRFPGPILERNLSSDIRPALKSAAAGE
ncbi:MAG: DsbE family thiol:disulfide interchange protein [Paracoccaceae bacterium]